MPAPTRPARPAGRRSAARGATAVAALLGLALAATASAPGTIRVRQGDTLSELAAEHGVTVAALKAANGRSGDTIYAGETLQVPGTREATSTSTTREAAYVVQPGDTVTAIARRHGTSIAAVVERNGLAPDARVRAGQRLVVPTTTRSVPASSGPTTTTVAPGTVGGSAAQHRAQLAAMSVPGKAEVRRMIAQTAGRYGVPAPLALAVAFQESGFQQRVVSPVDAIGVMQVLPRTGRGLERDAGRPLDLLDTQDNVTAGVLLLRQLLRSEGSVDAALAGYYQGVGSIARKGVLPQTVQYVRNINALMVRFANG